MTEGGLVVRISALGGSSSVAKRWPEPPLLAKSQHSRHSPTAWILVLSRADELDGNHYEILGPAADALEAKHPLAATVLRRAMIDFALAKARTKRYRHAARHLLQCESLNQEITDYRRFEAHNAYRNRLRTKHGRKTSFWSLLS